MNLRGIRNSEPLKNDGEVNEIILVVSGSLKLEPLVFYFCSEFSVSSLA